MTDYKSAKPADNPIAVKKRVKELYGYEVEAIRHLNSYDDRNYLIDTSDGKQLIVKITNSYETSLKGFIGINR